MSKADPPPPVDRTLIETMGGTPMGDHRETDPSTGMQRDYLVLSAEERAKGFVRPVRHAYKHLTCGTVTTMSSEIAETYARDPSFYDGTYCAGCKVHLPIGPMGDFVWFGTDERVGT